MPRGPLSFFGLGARVARPFIQLGVRLGRTISQIGAAVTRAGARVEVDQLRRIVTAERQLRRETAEVLGLPRNRIIDPQGIPEAITRQRRRFAWKVRTVFIDPKTGERIERFLTISTDDLLSPNEALAEANELMASEYGVQQSFIVESEIEQVTQAAPDRRL